jgi:hypothetical protein
MYRYVIRRYLECCTYRVSILDTRQFASSPVRLRSIDFRWLVDAFGGRALSSSRGGRSASLLSSDHRLRSSELVAVPVPIDQRLLIQRPGGEPSTTRVGRLYSNAARNWSESMAGALTVAAPGSDTSISGAWRSPGPTSLSSSNRSARGDTSGVQGRSCGPQLYGGFRSCFLRSDRSQSGRPG